jgi:methyltransferase (TIGR00027 family)
MKMTVGGESAERPAAERDSHRDVVSGVGLTALGVAAARAVETAREERLCADPFAAAFVTAAQPPTPLPTSLSNAVDSLWDRAWAMLATRMGVRTRFLDDYLLDAVGAGVRQVVILAAGLDTRAVRLRVPAETTVFELEQSSVLDFKERVLREQGARATCDRRLVGVDLREDWPAALARNGFDSTRPTVWLVEGLLPYLPANAEEQLLTAVSSLSAPGSRLGCTLTDTAALAGDPLVAALSECFGTDVTQLWYTDPRPDPTDWLADRGWHTAAVTAGQAGADYGRGDGQQDDSGLGPHSRYLTASRA